MRNDLVEKYQYYMTEAARLQQLVDEQADYIAELEKVLAMESNEDAAQAELTAADRVMADIMPGVKAKNRPMMKPKKPVDLTPEALKLKAQEDLEK